MKQIRDALRLNTAVTVVCSLSGASLVLIGIASPGSKVDRQEFCFKPPTTYEMQKVRHYDKKGNYSTKTERVVVNTGKIYCQGEKLYIGVSWRLAERIDENPELRKIHFKRKLPSKRPLAGWFTLSGSALLFTAWTIWNYGTHLYFESLQKLIRAKELEILDVALDSKMQSELLTRRYQHQTEYVVDQQDRKHGSLMRSELNDAEVLAYEDKAEKSRELLELQYELKKAQVKSLTSEQLEKESKSRLEIKKNQSKLGDPWEDEETTSLKKRLQEHEDGWLWDLVDSTKPLIIYGESGAYKSYFASCITLLKIHFLGAKLISIADPQWHQNRGKAWKSLIEHEPEEYGEYSDWDESGGSSYMSAIDALLQRCKERKEEDSPIISIWDELTKLGQYLPEESKVFMPEVISSPRKANEHVILITHNVNQSGLGNVEKMSEAIKSGTFRLMLKGSNKQKPLFKGLLDGWVNSEGDTSYKQAITLPHWVRVEKIQDEIEKCKS